MKNRRNYYRILHVQLDAPKAVITASYRTMMQKLRMHPDLGGDDWNASVINEAYAVLSNPDKRADYDQSLKQNRKEPAQRTTENPQPKTDDKPDPASAADPGKHCSHCAFCGTAHGKSHYEESSRCRTCNSPLTRANQLRLAGTSKRTFQRADHHAPLAFFVCPTEHTGHMAAIRDVSPHGLQFICSEVLEKTQVIRLECQILSATARVVRCYKSEDNRKYIVGVEFITLLFSEARGTFVSESA